MIDEKRLLEDMQEEIEFSKKCNMPLMTAGLVQAVEVIKNQTVIEEKHGEWIEDRFGYVCSNCKSEFSDELPFIGTEHKFPRICPECGANMRKRD